MSTPIDFLAPRTCFLTPIPELDEAADLLSQAADGLLAGNPAFARDLIKRADMPAVRAYASSVMGRISTDIHRYRTIAGLPDIVARPNKTKIRRLQPLEEMAVFERDGFRCRYCDCRVVISQARRIMMLAAPEELPWGARDKDRHAAFYALTAVADHFVPHARGGTSEPGNLITTCQPCNYGKGDSLVEQVGLINPWARPPICDDWDGLRRMLSHTSRASTRKRGPADGVRSGKSAASDTALQDGASIENVSRDDWFSALNRSHRHLSTRLLAFLEESKDLKVTWSLRKALIVHMSVGDRKLAILGIDRDGGVEVPWDITGHKEKFRQFAHALERAIPGALAYETKHWWRVKKNGRNLELSELLDDLSALRAAFEDLHAALAD
ncbi:HNH endonuclease [Acidisphaera sp. S103]|uniref:HNH endonuclease n=1 Tax=Acidisphaera sp. S103 TaxID=1747223 RepID=UPI00131CC565|nr:HNH endonuclease [Acidisphaera sp. S103]